MRIAYVTETWPPELNGVSLTAARTVAFLHARGHDVRVVRPRPVSYTHLTLPTKEDECRSRWSPYH